MIISTGDELVEINRSPEPHQIRRSNVYRLRATLDQLGIPADTHHMKDNYEEIAEKLRQIAAEYEVIILSGGVSKGKFDYLPDVLEDLGVKKLFHRIRQRPGKPFWFGESPKGKLIFALPGNPVSSFLCTHRYFIPWLRKCLGYPDRSQPHAILKEDFTFTPDLTYFLQVRVDYDEQGRIWATPEEGNGSGDLANLVDADAFLQLPRGRNEFKAGEVFPLFFYR
jgi:molybdopterin molybdotransferase